MAGWGVKLLGFSRVMGGLEDIQTRLDDDAVYVVGTNVSYAVFVELGTSRMNPIPFLFPSAREAERSIQRIAGNAQSVEEAVKRVALFIERRAAERAPVDTGNLRASIRTEKVR